MRFIALIVLTLFFQSAIGQININGAIQDENKTPLSYVNVIAYKTSDSILAKGVVSDENGKFNINLQSGSYNLELSLMGYKTESFTVSNSKDFGTITLVSQSEELEGVTVVAQKPLIQREQDKLVVNVEGNIANVGNSTLDILQKSPGVVVDQDNNISLNGRNGVRIYIDGKDTRLSGSELGTLLSNMPSSNIEKVEIISNPSAKYEAQGSAGIINIVTKQGKLYGTNGSIRIAPGYGRHFRWENSVNFNHRQEKFNIYGQYALAKRNQWMKIDIDRSFLDETGNVVSSYELRNLFKMPVEVHTPRIGMDFQPNKNTTYGILLTGMLNSGGQDAVNNIRQFDENHDLFSIQQTDTHTETQRDYYTGNFNFRHNFKNKSLIDFDFDMAKYLNKSNENYDTSSFSPDGTPTNGNILTGFVDGSLNLYGLTLDYERPFENGNKLETGWKNTWVTTDNDLKYFDTIDGEQVSNERLTNRFIYDEAIYGAYVSYSINKKKWNAQFGLRGEYTDIIGTQVTTNETFDIDYLKLFPSLSYNYTINENHLLGVSLSRRIDRPGYNQLNPFRFFVDTNTFRIGDPYLQPQFTWSSEINYTLKNKYYFALSYGYTEDFITGGILQDGEEQSVLVKPINIDNVKSISLTASAPLKVGNWLQSNFNLSASYNHYEGLVTGSQLDQSTPIVNFTSNHNLSIGKGYKMNLSTFHLFPHYFSITRVETISSISLGVQKSFWEGNGTISLNVNDIFFDQYPVGTTQFGQLDDKFYSYRDTRFATLAFTWNFGKQTVKSQRRRRLGVQEELNRARQQDN